MKHYNVRDRLIDGTIKVIARDGLDKATTKAITKETALYETYIYQYFSGKDGLFAEAFEKLDEELLYVSLKNLQLFSDMQVSFRQRAKTYFDEIWKFMLGNKEKCIAFIRYYYSPYFNKFSAQKHTQRYEPLVEKISIIFKNEANVWMLLSYMLSTALMFAITVIDGALEDNEDTREHVFRVIYNAVNTYFD